MRFKILILFVAWVCLGSCGQRKEKLPDGWYRVDHRNDPYGNAIVTPSDFEEIRLDSAAQTGGQTVYVIVGRLKANRIAIWAEATEKAIGNSLAFVFDGEKVACPSVNARIGSGSFSIGLPPDKQDGEKIHRMFQKLTEEMIKEESTGKELHSFDSLFHAWVYEYRTNSLTKGSSNTNHARKLESYSKLLAGKKDYSLPCF